jgi:hypothetical protein
MEARVQRVLVWCGPAMMILWIGAFLFIAGFLPPSDPALSAERIVALYAENTTHIRIGMVLSMLGSALLVPYAAAISGQLERIEGARALATTQMASCALLSLEFIMPIAVWMTAAFRFDDRAADVTRTLHDLGWILFIAVVWSLWVQLIAIGIAILIDRRSQPVFPRWLGYLNLWVAVLILPAGTILFFKSGPFAWNGIIGLWVPFAGYAIWFIPMTWVMHRNLTRQISEGTGQVP